VAWHWLRFDLDFLFSIQRIYQLLFEVVFFSEIELCTELNVMVQAPTLSEKLNERCEPNDATEMHTGARPRRASSLKCFRVTGT
jgi:hypothetical protein